jgi:hypothetical protein
MAAVPPALEDVTDVVQRLELTTAQHHELRAKVTTVLSRAHQLRAAIDAAGPAAETAA